MENLALKHRLMLFFINSVILFALVSPIHAAEPLPIGMENFPPFEFEKEGKVVGVDTEIVALVLTRLGYIPDIRVLPWARAQKYAREGTIAAIYSITKNSEREKFYYFSDPINTVKDVFFKRRDHQISWKTLKDLKDYRIGISRGYNYAPVFMKALEEKLFSEIHLLSGDELERRQLIKLKKGRIDLCICEISVCKYLIQTHAPEFDMIDFIDVPIGEIRPYYIAFSKLWPGAQALVTKFNAELKKVMAEGRIKVILQKYHLKETLEAP
ncbi:MAG: amino acid ABC transporter substrate-binding protein [Desulfobacterium sp.]|nr:amino acid ABC transporter substrate-binding protein [Desulfobacterium sp.]